MSLAAHRDELAKLAREDLGNRRMLFVNETPNRALGRVRAFIDLHHRAGEVLMGAMGIAIVMILAMAIPISILVVVVSN